MDSMPPCARSHQLHLLSANSWQVHCSVREEDAEEDAEAEMTVPLRGPQSSEEGNERERAVSSGTA